jgi:gliding motility-associated-like protein
MIGDPKLEVLAGYPTLDPCKLEFDIVPAGDSLSFAFTFASEEYSEYVCTRFNDVFGFFISGPGIIGDPALDNSENIALIPGTTDAVTIDNVNSGNPNVDTCGAVNPQFHHLNPLSPFSAIQYDGWTTDLIATADNLIPCETYHLELIIADASDRLWDSGVFIDKIRSNNVVVDITTQGGNNVMYEACNDGIISLCLESAINTPTEVTFYLQGDAVNGVDYETIGDPTPGVAQTATIPANQTCVFIAVNTIDDGIAEGLETFQVVVENPLCESVLLDSVQILLYDQLEVYVMGDSLLCEGESTNLTLDSGGTSFQWTSLPAVTFTPDDMATEVTITPTETTEVIITTTIASCTAQDTLVVQVSDMELEFDIMGISCDGACDGSIDMTILNGVSPFIITWNSQPAPEDIFDLCPGFYEVRVVDAAGCLITETVEVGLAPPIQVVVTPVEYNGGFNVSCNGASDGQVDVVVVGGGDIVSIVYSNGPNNLPAGLVTVTVTDDNGCTTIGTATLSEPDVLTAEITDVQPAGCLGANNGAATLNCVGGSGSCPEFLWYLSGDLVNSGPTYSGAPAGTYDVDFTDQNGCSGTIQVVIPGSTSILTGIIVSQTNILCNGEGLGSVEVAGQGGTLNPGSEYGYLWQDAPITTPDRSGLSAGSYIVEISDDVNCSVLFPITITEPSPLQVDIAVSNDIQCEGQSCGNALAVASGGTPGNPSYSYVWETVPPGLNPDFPVTTSAASFCLPGDYNVTVTDENGCTADTTITIVIISSELTATFVITDVLCAGESTGAIDATVSGGVGAYTYQWIGGNCNQGPIVTEDLNMVCAGVWCVTITDTEGCSIDTCLTINEPPALNYFFEMTPTLCADDCSGSIDFTPTGGTPTYTYEWYGPVFPIDTAAGAFDGLPLLSTDEDISNLCKGQYLVILIDSEGCTFERRITVTAPDDLVILTDSISDYNGFQISCPGLCDGWIYITATGGVVAPAYDYQFTWQEQSLGFTSQGSGAGFDDLTDLCASQDTVGYEVIIVDDNDCIQNEFFLMEEPDEITFSYDVTDVTCSGLTDGEVTVSIAGGVPGFTIYWTNAAMDTIGNGLTISNLAEGVYTISVVDMNGCTAQGMVTVSTPNPIVIDLNFVPQDGGEAIGCDGVCDATIFAIISGGTSDYTYDWSDTDCAGPYFSSEPSSVGGLCEGTYYLNITDAQGCVLCDSIVLTGPEPIISTPIQIDASCEDAMDGSIDLGLSGGVEPYDIVWTPNVGTGQVVTGLGEGQYIANVTDSIGCTAQFVFQIDEPAELIVVPSSPIQAGGFNVSCLGACDASLTVDISGGTGNPVTILWSGPAPVGGSNVTAFGNVVCAGTYTITVTDGACVVTEDITVTAPPMITVDFTLLQDISCFGDCNGQIQATAIGGASGFTYLWDDSDMTTGPITPSDLCAGTYCVTVTDAILCQVIECFDLVEPDTLELSCIVTDVSCTGQDDGSIACTLTGGTLPYTCTWSGPGGFTSSSQNIADLPPGEYCVECVDENGCSVEACYTVGEPTPLILTSTVSDYNGFEISCPGECDGTIDLTAVGGTPGYTFLPAQNLVDLCEGPVTVSVTDSEGCIISQTIDMTAPDPLMITLSSPLYDCGTNVNCTGSNTGAITSVVTGGVPDDLTYYWINVLTGDTIESGNVPEIDQLMAGEYQLIVVDANGCEFSQNIILTEPAVEFDVELIPSLNPDGSEVPCAGGCGGTLEFNPIGACGDVIYNVTIGGVPANLEDMCAGDYVITASDEAECTYTGFITFNEPDSLIVTADVQETLCPGDESGSVTIIASGGIPDYNFDWPGDIPDEASQTELPAGDYTVFVSDFNGCEETIDITIFDPDSMELELFSPILLNPDYNISSFMGSNGSIDATVTGGTEPYTFNWSGAGLSFTVEDPQGLPADTFCVVVTDANGCIVGDCIPLSEPLDLELPNGISPNGDGLNDGLEIHGIEAYPDNIVKIFNRWGDEVYERKGYQNSDQWRGESTAGGIVPDGTYFVILTVNDGERQLDAYLELRR